jgi:hypothetical protein
MSDFARYAERMQSAVSDGTLKIIQTGTSLGDLGVVPAFDGGFYFYVLECTNCGREDGVVALKPQTDPLPRYFT